MRLIHHRVAVLLHLLAAGRGRADTAIDALKEEAARAYRTGRYDVACPLFEQVLVTAKYDAWGWNDLALCRIRALAFDRVLEPLQKAAALEKVVGDEPLRSALATNEGLLVKALRAHPGARGTGLPAAVMGIKRFDADDRVTGCALLAQAEATGEVTFDASEWARIARCRVEAGAKAPDVVAALVTAREGGAPVEDVVNQLIEREQHARPDAADWKKRCVPLDGSACGRNWLLCSLASEGEHHSMVLDETVENLVVIEAATLKRWKRSPFEVAGERVLQSTTRREYCRCDVPGMPGISAVGEGLTQHQVLHVDACTATAAVWDLDAMCQSNGGAFSNVPVEPVPLPQVSAPH